MRESARKSSTQVGSPCQGAVAAAYSRRISMEGAMTSQRQLRVLAVAVTISALTIPSRLSATAPVLLVSGLEGGSGSTIGPGGALYVTESAAGRISRIDPQTGAVTTFASGLPPAIASGSVEPSTSRSSASRSCQSTKHAFDVLTGLQYALEPYRGGFWLRTAIITASCT